MANWKCGKARHRMGGSNMAASFSPYQGLVNSGPVSRLACELGLGPPLSPHLGGTARLVWRPPVVFMAKGRSRGAGGSAWRVPAVQAGGPEFKPQNPYKPNKHTEPSCVVARACKSQAWEGRHRPVPAICWTGSRRRANYFILFLLPYLSTRLPRTIPPCLGTWHRAHVVLEMPHQRVPVPASCS